MQELWFLQFACCLMLIDSHIKFHEDMLTGVDTFFMMDKVPNELIQKI